MNEKEIMRKVLKFQKGEITEYKIYDKLSRTIKGKNGEILKRISEDELKHYKAWSKYTGKQLKPNAFLVFFYILLSRLLGITFAIKMMERGEENAEKEYAEIKNQIPEADEILKDEFKHERMLINMIDEERIGYISSMVLGVNDAIVELTGTLAGLTFALRNTRIVGIAGVITGIAASLSMAASEYLSQRSEIGGKKPLKAAFYTGTAYIFTVILLVFPYFLFSSYIISLSITILNAILVIFIFTFFMTVVRSLKFRKIFIEMLTIGLGVALTSFLIGWGVRKLLKIDI